MSFALHGRYCGPGWSENKWQESVVGILPGIDEFDETCRCHDAAYARGHNRSDADYKFAYQNITSLSPFRMISGLGVGLQGVGRDIVNGLFGEPSVDRSNRKQIRATAGLESVPVTPINDNWGTGHATGYTGAGSGVTNTSGGSSSRPGNGDNTPTTNVNKSTPPPSDGGQGRLPTAGHADRGQPLKPSNIFPTNTTVRRRPQPIDDSIPHDSTSIKQTPNSFTLPQWSNAKLLRKRSKGKRSKDPRDRQ